MKKEQLEKANELLFKIDNINGDISTLEHDIDSLERRLNPEEGFRSRDSFGISSRLPVSEYTLSYLKTIRESYKEKIDILNKEFNEL
jgi:hypothetical protein